MVDVTIDGSVLQVGGSFTVTAAVVPQGIVGDHRLVAHKDQEGGVSGVVAVVNFSLDGGCRSVVGHGLHINIDALLLLPCHPVLERGAVGEG